MENGDSLSADSPSLAEVAEMLRGLLSGQNTRSEIEAWARPWVISFDEPIEDETIYAVVDAMSMVNSPSPDRDYLYGDSDFHAWLDEIENAMRDR